jgi:hypothetical protein
MFTGYWRIILAVVGLLAFGGISQLQAAAGDSPKVEASANRSAQEKENSAANAVTPRVVGNREQAVQPDCGTPKECRAEQRSKDDLVAQQLAAKSADSQRRAAWWQTGVGAAGVILLILTVIYTHLATRAAINSVKTLIAVERARVSVPATGVVNTKDGKTATFSLSVRNSGRTAGTLRETSIGCSKTGLFKDFVPQNVKKQNTLIPKDGAVVDTLEFGLGGDNRFIVGYYKFSTIFSTKLVTDYFCYEIEDATKAFAKARKAQKAAADAAYAEAVQEAANEGKPPPPKPRGKGAVSANVPSRYRTDLDWPPDED